MNWTLFIRGNCHDCDKVIAWMDANGIVYELDDIDRPGLSGAPRLFAAPALLDGTELRAYGVDIITFLENAGR